MATKYSEAVLAVKYREVDEDGRYVGGPMYYIRNGLGRHWAWLGWAFAFFGMVASFGLGNMVQANAMAEVLTDNTALHLPHWLTGVIVATLVGSVIIGGIRRIADVAEYLVPFMAGVYITGAMIIIVLNIDSLPGVIGLIVSSAFTGTAATGGFLGATIWMAMRWGFARGIFSNEAGLGSAAIAHAAARAHDPVRQGMVAMLGTFIDTIIVCSMTAFVILLTGAWQTGLNGPDLSAHAFNTGLPAAGAYIVTFGLLVFAFTSIIGWSFYGERCAEYIFGVRVIIWYRLLWVVTIVIGATRELQTVWLVSDVLNGLMAIPNLIALLLLSPIIFTMTRQYFANHDR